MKKLLFLKFVILICANGQAQIEFKDHVIIDNSASTDGVISVYTIDIDGDSDMDVLSISQNDNKITWYQNIDGKGNFGVQQIISTDVNLPTSVFAMDLDGDGDADVLSASENDNKIAWYENTNGQGSFGSQKIIATNADGAKSVYATDIDGDGDMDVISASKNDDKIAWYENTNGQGVFGSAQIISNDQDKAITVSAADIDGDGDMDIISSNDASIGVEKVVWFENTDGLGTFSTQKIIDNMEYQNPRFVLASDIDGDNYIDVLICTDFGVYWYKNIDGKGTFDGKRVVNSATRGVFYPADIDGDGDIDVVTGSRTGSKIAWVENSGLGSFSSEKIISYEVLDPSSVFVSDIDGDGHMDVASASFTNDNLTWYKNNDGLGSFSSRQTITRNANGANNVYAADLDGDGDLDVISSNTLSNGKIAWYENTDGQGNFSLQQIINTEKFTPTAFEVFDIDGDGDNDIVVATAATSGGSYDKPLLWFENTDGLGNFGPSQNIESYAKDAHCIYAADMDGDGHKDIISSENNSYSDKIFWIRNIDGQADFNGGYSIPAIVDFPTAVHAADIDGDGDMDVLSASFFDNKIAWYENTDVVGRFNSRVTITTDADRAKDVFAADLDGDGDLDVISANDAIYGIDRIAWYENTDGLGNFGPQQTIMTSTDSPQSIYCIDLDNDGDIDILSASKRDNKIAWYENTDGLANFGPQQIITTTTDGAESVFPADIDGDGDIDVLSASSRDGKIAWHENLSSDTTLSVNPFKNSNLTVFPIPSKDVVYIKNTKNIGIKNLSIFSTDGIKLIDQEKNFNAINISHLSNGIYFLLLRTDTSEFVQKIIKE